ncbi:hypothetical protein KAR91_27395 [Candidatus Pacearchaeota archaeon]|nr:hypothetical protein [Candidatus Pacearchaeota archaeon]
MKRLLFVMVPLTTLSVVVMGFSVVSLYDKVRQSGAATPNTDVFYIAQDSADSFNVDTTYSDTIVLENYKYLNLSAQMTGYSLADSANDSLVAVIQGYGMYRGSFHTLLYTDTLPTSLGTLDSTDVQLQTIRIDTVGFNQFYIRTIYKDSFVSELTTPDTTEVRMEYKTLQSLDLPREL